MSKTLYVKITDVCMNTYAIRHSSICVCLIAYVMMIHLCGITEETTL